MNMKKRAGVIVVPGGAYNHLSQREGAPVARAFEAMGLAADVLKYTVRGPGDGPLGLAPVRQLARAVDGMRERHPSLAVFVCGFSAGGHLAATLGVHWRTLGLSRPDGLILSYPVITAAEELTNTETLRNIAGAGERDFFSLEKHVTPETPPAFLWHTASDESVPVENSMLFASALRRAGVPFELHIYPFGKHGLSLATGEVAQPENGRFPDAHVAGWIHECGEWIDRMISLSYI